MKSLRLLALVLRACTCSAAAALACDPPKSAASATSATTASATPTTGKTPAVPLDGGCSAVPQGYKTTAEAAAAAGCPAAMAPQCTPARRAEEHTSELQSRFGISYAVFCLKKK